MREIFVFRTISLGLAIAFFYGPLPMLLAGERNSDRKTDSVIVDMTAPSGLSSEKREEWQKLHEKIWAHTIEKRGHIDLGNRNFSDGKYEDALKAYDLALSISESHSEEDEVRWGIARSYEALGNFEKALAEVDYLSPRYAPNTMAAPDLKAWKEILIAATQKRYDLATKLLQDQLASAPDWKKQSDFLEQRLRLMEERAHAVGQLQPEGN